MAGVILGSDSERGNTAVSNMFIDEYMADANGEYVKIYLYLLRCMNSGEESILISRMADKFDHTEKDIRRALRYWEKVKLLRLEFDDEEQLTGIYLVDTAKAKKSKKGKGDSVSLRRESKSEEVRQEKKEDMPPTKTYYTKDDLENFGKDETVQEMLYAAERMCGRNLTQTDSNTILFWYEELGFSADVIEYLVEYSVENGHKSIRYMEKVAQSWKEAGIATVAEAKEHVKSRSRIYNKVIKCFGITGRGLGETELAFLDKWKKEYKFTDEMIAEACRRTMEATHNPSFAYADSILTRWKDNKITNLTEVEEADAAHRREASAAAENKAAARRKISTVNKFNNFEQRTYNYEQIEKQFEEQLLNSARRKD